MDCFLSSQASQSAVAGVEAEVVGVDAVGSCTLIFFFLGGESFNYSSLSISSRGIFTSLLYVKLG